MTAHGIAQGRPVQSHKPAAAIEPEPPVRIGDHAGDAFQHARHIRTHFAEGGLADARGQPGFAGHQQHVLVLQQGGHRPDGEALARIEGRHAAGIHAPQAAIGIAQQQRVIAAHRHRRTCLLGQARLAVPLRMLVVQDAALADTGPGFLVVGEQHRLQGLTGVRGWRRNAGRVAVDGAHQVDPVELPQWCRCLARGLLQLRGALAQQ